METELNAFRRVVLINELDKVHLLKLHFNTLGVEIGIVERCQSFCKCIWTIFAGFTMVYYFIIQIKLPE